MLVTCSGTEIAKVSGFKLAFGGKVKSEFMDNMEDFGNQLNPQNILGTEVETAEASESEDQEVEAKEEKEQGIKLNFFAFLALLLAVIGLITALILGKDMYIVPLALAVIGFLAMLFIKSVVKGSMKVPTTPQVADVIKIKYQFGYYLALLGFIAAAVAAFFAGSKKAEYAREQFSNVIPDKVEDAFDKAKASVTEAGTNVIDKAEDAYDKVKDTVVAAGASVIDKVDDTIDKVKDAVTDEKEEEEKTPIDPEDKKTT